MADATQQTITHVAAFGPGYVVYSPPVTALPKPTSLLLPVPPPGSVPLPTAPSVCSVDTALLAGLDPTSVSGAPIGNFGSTSPGLSPTQQRFASNVLLTGFPVETDDYLRMRARGNTGAVTVSFYGRLMRPDGVIIPMNFPILTDALATTFTRQIQPGVGTILNYTASVPLGTATNGTIEVVAELGRLVANVFVPHTLLFSGQVTPESPVSTVQAPSQQEEKRYGYFVGSSFAGSSQFRNIVITPPAGKRIRFIWAFTPFTNAAVAAQRGYSYVLRVGANDVWSNGPNAYADNADFGTLYGALDGLLDTAVPAPGGAIPLTTRFSPDLWFSQAVQLTAVYFNFQVGDGFGFLNCAWQEQ